MKELVCIVCPNGCCLQVEGEGDGLRVTGNLCPKGLAFAKAETTHPTRSLTTTVRAVGAALPVLPVRTEGEIPKEKLFEAMAQLGRVRVRAPVICGQRVLADLAGSGVAVVATCTLPACKKEAQGG